MNEIIKCPKCGEKWRLTIKRDLYRCNVCRTEWRQNPEGKETGKIESDYQQDSEKDDVMRKPPEAHGCEQKNIIRKSDKDGNYELYMDYFKSYGITFDKEEKSTRPIPCLRDEHGEIREQTVKQLLEKINEELDELKAVVFYSCDVYDPNCLPESCDDMIHTRIAAEAADTITAITTMLEALGIDAEMRDDAQRRVNEKNRERGRLND